MLPSLIRTSILILGGGEWCAEAVTGGSCSFQECLKIGLIGHILTIHFAYYKITVVDH